MRTKVKENATISFSDIFEKSACGVHALKKCRWFFFFLHQ